MCACVCISVCLCVHAHCFVCLYQDTDSSPFSWRKPPEETYADVNIFGLQTVFVLVSVHVQVDK